MEDKRNRKRRKIGNKMLAGIVAFALVLVVVISSAVSYGVLAFTYVNFINELYNYTGIASQIVRGDRVEGYLNGAEEDRYYEYVDSFLNSMCDEVSLEDLSVITPDEEGIEYLWDTGKSGAGHKRGDRVEWEDIDSKTKENILSACDRNTSDTAPERKMMTDNNIMSVFAPVRNAEGKAVAVIRADRVLLHGETIIMQAFAVVGTVTAILTAIMMLIFYKSLKKRLIKPIRVLTKNAEMMVGNLERDQVVNIDVHTNDELETLADAFTKMDFDLREYIQELSEATSEREKISAELNIAAGIQEGMLPKLTSEFSGNTAFDLSAAMIPAKEVGGDFYDFFMVDDTHIALIMADVSGKGIPGSLFMAVSKLLLKNSVKEGAGPAEALGKVNERLMESNEMEMFVTVWLAIIDLETGEGVAANAGHEHPALRHKDGLFEMVKYKHSLAVATFDGLKFKEHTFKIEPGDTIFVYTDGVTEAEDIDENFFGEARLVEALNSDPDALPDELIRNVRSAIWDFRGSASQFDDITMLSFRYNGK